MNQVMDVTHRIIRVFTWPRGHKCSILAIAFLISSIGQVVFGLQCYVGLGNSSQRENQKIVDCPAQGNYVCVKMFGGGMGDQIRRYCDKIPPKEYGILQEKEERKRSPDYSGTEEDSECYDTVHNGRDVVVCECTTDKCNSANKGHHGSLLIVATSLASVLARHL